MPCRDYRDNVSYTDVEQARNESKARLDELTRLLCIACSELQEKIGGTNNPELETWYAEHRQADLDNMQGMLSDIHEIVDQFTKEDFDGLDEILNKLKAKY